MGTADLECEMAPRVQAKFDYLTKFHYIMLLGSNPQ